MTKQKKINFVIDTFSIQLFYKIHNPSDRYSPGVELSESSRRQQEKNMKSR